MANIRLVVLGDSVNWGQGLRPQYKFSSLVYNAITGKEPDQDCVMLAHSGAVIGIGTSCHQLPVHSEVPKPCPTILDQCTDFADNPKATDLVLLNGAINDIGVGTILNPFLPDSELERLIELHCYRHMKDLLNCIKERFGTPKLQVVVSSYFPILSKESDISLVVPFLALHGIAVAPIANMRTAALLDRVIANCQQFWKESSTALARAVKEMNSGRRPMFFFAKPPFKDSNATFAPQSWLWGLDKKDRFNPVDMLVKERRSACNRDEENPIARQGCYRASVAHPDVTGSQKFADAILKVLG